MNCIYNSEIELECVNPSMMDSYAAYLVSVDPSVSEYKQGVQTELRMRSFCARCLQLQIVLRLQNMIGNLEMLAHGER